MTAVSLAGRGLKHFRGSFILLFTGTLLSATVLTGALLVGDSVKKSLFLYAEQRLGGIEYAVELPRRYIDESLCAEISDAAGSEIAGVLKLRGSIALSAGGALSVNVIGIDEHFPGAAGREQKLPERTGIILNRRAAELGRVSAGDIVTLSVEKPSVMSRDMPLSSRMDRNYGTAALLVCGIAEDSDLGKFSLRAEQVPAVNVFISRARLQEMSGLNGKINLVLAGPQEGTANGSAFLNDRLKAVWKLKYAGYSFVERDDGSCELKTDRIFIEPSVARAAEAYGGAGRSAYLVNSISSVRNESRSTPYSFVLAGAGEPAAPAGMQDDEAAVNSWLAEKTGVGPGDGIRVRYFRFSAPGSLEERERIFRVKSVTGMDKAAQSAVLMPAFPGLSDVESCSSWEIGMPLDPEKVKDRDNEDYWNSYRDTPKLFLTAAAAREMWGSYFGEMTSYKLDREGAAGVEAELGPDQFGAIFRPVAEEAEEAVNKSMDFGGLFLGLSFFLVAASLLLTGLLFSFTVLRRSREAGILRAAGYSKGRIILVYTLEAIAVAVPGACAGALLSMAYTMAFIYMLNRFWSGAVAGALIVFDMNLASLAAGAAASVVLVSCVVMYSIVRLTRKQTVELLSGRVRENVSGETPGFRWLAAAITMAAAAAGIIFSAGSGQNAAGAFFGAGFLLLAAAVAAGRFWIGRLGEGGRLSVRYAGLRNAGRRQERSMAMAAFTAIGCFMVISVACMVADPVKDADEKWSGTGGFDLIVEFAVPVQDDLLTEEGISRLGFRDAEAWQRSNVVLVKVREGDDASCLNLNRAGLPMVMGFDDALMARLGAFGDMESSIDCWNKLAPGASDTIQVLAGDRDTAQWGLGARTGDELNLTDDAGGVFSVRLAGELPVRKSILQGRLIMGMNDFVRKYPSEDGYRMLLIDCPPGRAEIMGRAIEKTFRNYGPAVTTASERLGELYAVENTYMGMFGALGGLGLLLGALGTGIAAALNIMQRRSEIGMLRAVGFRKRTVAWMIFAEYGFLLVYGLVSGTAAALISVWPNVKAGGSVLPAGLLALIVPGIAAAGLASVLAAAWYSLKGSPISSLRME